MSTISASTTTTTAYKVTADTTGALVLQSGSGPTTAVTIDTSQNVGIAVTSPAAKLDVLGDIFARASTLRFKDSGNTTQYGAIYGDSTSFHVNAGVNNLIFYSAGSERARIDSSGNFLVGKTSATTSTVGAELQPTAAAGYIAAFTSDAQRAVIANRLTSDGSLYSMRRSGTEVGTISVTTSATAYNTSSDYRLKEDVQPMTGALARVAALKPVTYKWKVDGSDGEGFIAHELAEVCPHAVSGEKDAVDEEGNPQYQGIDVSFLVGMLTAAIQELTQRIEQLEAK